MTSLPWIIIVASAAVVAGCVGMFIAMHYGQRSQTADTSVFALSMFVLVVFAICLLL